MTPKEKASQLIEQFQTDVHSDVLSLEAAQECAIIAVKEILNAQTEVYGSVRVQNGTVFNQFWIEVRQEIEKL